ncbi:MAG: hypothetical protein B7Z55_18590 [Planctomycetales bacterium 12-60-4]|nr:MAG: hypothetical protein B7Z55_18590 [Planctomycetales bacterium 12-60-4]
MLGDHENSLTNSRLPMHRGTLAKLAAANCLLLATILAGCGAKPEGPPTFPVHGTLMVNGGPATNAQVILHPVGGKDFDQRGARPTGKVGADGRFDLTTYRPGDGAPAGQYLVTVFWAENPDSLEPSPDRLKGSYLDPSKSTLKVVVHEEETVLEPLMLTTP